MSAADILFERRGAAGLVTLNRPQRSTPSRHAMVLACARSSMRGRTIPRSPASSSRPPASAPFRSAAISARSTDLGKAGKHDEMLQFWRDEYPLNAAIKNYRKPYVALIDGMVMGGGVGVSVHGSHRVAGDRFQFAMPEVGIGFFPDVGATWFLPRMPGELGTYCALTGERFGVADALRRRHRHPPHSRRRGLPRCSMGLPVRSRSMRCWPRSRKPAARGRSWRGAGRSTGCLPAAPWKTSCARSTARHSGSGCRVGGENRRDHADEIAAQPEDRAGASAPRQDMGLRDVHARRIPHSVAHHRRP